MNMVSVPDALALAVQHHQSGMLAEAENLYRRILQVEPRNPDALHFLGVLAHQSGRSDLAVDYIQQAIRLHPEFPAPHNNLGIALSKLGKLDEAIANYRQALHLKPDFAEAYNNLGNALLEKGKVEEAAANFQQALRLMPNYADAYNNLGNALREQGKVEEAAASYRQALRLKPNYPDAHVNLGIALTELGRMDEAITCFREAIRIDPKHTEALRQLAGLLLGKLPEADRTFLERRLTESDLNESDRVKLLFGLAEVCDAKGEYAKAASLLRQANSLTLSLPRWQGRTYSLDENARFVENLMTAFTPAFFERMRGFGLETERPVFILGLPRSGTTLTDQILAAHTQVVSAGELFLARGDFLALGVQPTDESVFTTLPTIGGDALRRQAQCHLDQLGAINRTASRVVNKMPENYFYLGLLAAMFPRAKFIHCRRDLRDVAVSCWFTYFRDIQWASDLEHIAVRFQEYQRLMEHWQRVLPVPVLEVRYEETVADLPGSARRLVEWCGLEWEPTCLAFHEGKKAVRTASAAQVRQPLYTKSVARWRNYERDLDSLFTALTPLVG
jgi:tetratricopeptide (TPR) repeat protein